MKKNIDLATVASFGDEWSRFDQTGMSDGEARKVCEEYFAVFPWSKLSANAVGFDMGCGSGRWASFVAPRVGHLSCIDPSSALDVARKMLVKFPNTSFHVASVDDAPLPAGSQDFGYSLGVLHHVPDTVAAIRSCAVMLKSGAPFLLYLYYAFDNRTPAYRLMWQLSDLVRRIICRLPPRGKQIATDILALLVYWPLARVALLLERLGISVSQLPLSYYRNHSWYTMRTDSRDRFGTPLERRFTRNQIKAMMEQSGLTDIRFSEAAPYWCAVGLKQS